MNRRAFLIRSLALAGAVRAQEPQLTFPTDPRRRLAISTYAFRSVIKSPRPSDAESMSGTLSLEEFALDIPRRFGVCGIEPWSGHFESTDHGYVRHLASTFHKAGVRVVGIPVDTAPRPCTEASRNPSETRETWVDIAVTLGSPSVRVPLTEKAPEACIKDNLFKIVDYGKRKNIIINLENIDAGWDEAVRITNVIGEVQSPFLRALPNFCDSALAGDERYANRALRLMFAHAYNLAHVNDERVQGGTRYRTSVPDAFKMARQFGYRGYFSIEWEGEGDPYAATERLLRLSLENLS